MSTSNGALERTNSTTAPRTQVQGFAAKLGEETGIELLVKEIDEAVIDLIAERWQIMSVGNEEGKS